MAYVNNLINSLFPNADSLTSTVMVVFFAIIIWLFNQIKKQFDESDIKKAERADLALVQLGQLLTTVKKETSKKEEIYEKFTNTVPYLEYEMYKELKNELEKENVELKLIEERVINTMSTIYLKYSYQNELSSSSIIFQIEGFVRPVKNIIKSLLLTFSIIFIIGYFLVLYTFSENMFLTIIKFFVTLLSFFLFVGVFELFYKNKLAINMNNILLFILIIGITIGIILLSDIWKSIILILGYLISLFFLFRTFQKEKNNEDEVRNGIAMEDLSFKEHVERIKKNLDLDNDMPILVGKDAFKYAYNHDKLYRKNHKKSLKWEFRNIRLNGLYLWWENENTVLLKNENVGTLAHELRHAWQYKNRVEKGFEFNKYVKELYKSSTKELDANEYAQSYCEEIGLQKLAEKYSKKVKLIEKRIKE